MRLFIIPIVLTILVVGFLYFLTSSNTTPAVQALTVIASSLAAVASIWNTFSAYQNSLRLEELKQKLSLKFPALQETTAAAVGYYYTLSKLESGKFDVEEVKHSEEVMEKVTGKIFFLSESYQNAWYSFWQKARFISESVIGGISEDEARANWQKDWCKDLSALLANLEVSQEKA